MFPVDEACGRRTGRATVSSDERLGKGWEELAPLPKAVRWEPRDGVYDSGAVGGYDDKGGDRGVGEPFKSPLFVALNDGATAEGS